MPTLREIYENAKTTTRNPTLLAKRAGTTVKSARTFLTDEGSSQTTEKWRRTAATVYAPTGAPQDHWQADVVSLQDYMGVNKKRTHLLSMLNTTTRFAAARPLLNTKASTVSTAMAEIIEELEGLGKTVAAIRVDGGSEFKKEFAADMAEAGIPLQKAEPLTHYRLARTDRFHRTLRERLGELFERENNNRWIDALPDIIANYNGTPHSALSEVFDEPTAPEDVTLSGEERIRRDEMERAQQARVKTDALGISDKRGETQVRLLVRQTKAGLDKFSKSQRAVWTPTVYKVLERNGPNSWRVDVPRGEVSIFPSWALKVVDTKRLNAPAKRDEKVFVPVARAKRMEARNISEAEQAAALAGPARPKRVAVRPDYARLARGR